MKQLAIRFGLLAGLFIAFVVIASMPFFSEHSNMMLSMVANYTAQIIAFSSIFVAVKTYRDKHLGGQIAFGPAFLLGLYISLIGSTIYLISWAIDYNFFMPDFMDKYAAGVMREAAADGASAQEMAEMQAKLAQGKEMYKNPIYFSLYTYAEILPTGLIMSLAAGLFMKRKSVAVA